jgi:hypothetical protein
VPTVDFSEKLLAVYSIVLVELLDVVENRFKNKFNTKNLDKYEYWINIPVSNKLQKLEKRGNCWSNITQGLFIHLECFEKKHVLRARKNSELVNINYLS